jgi:hypothetical protein
MTNVSKEDLSSIFLLILCVTYCASTVVIRDWVKGLSSDSPVHDIAKLAASNYLILRCLGVGMLIIGLVGACLSLLRLLPETSLEVMVFLLGFYLQDTAKHLRTISPPPGRASFSKAS